MPRYFVKNLGGAAKVDDLIGLSPSNHGTDVSGTGGADSGFCLACRQQAAGSAFLTELNAGDETPGDVDYTVDPDPPRRGRHAVRLGVPRRRRRTSCSRTRARRRLRAPDDHRRPARRAVDQERARALRPGRSGLHPRVRLTSMTCRTPSRESRSTAPGTRAAATPSGSPNSARTPARAPSSPATAGCGSRGDRLELVPLTRAQRRRAAAARPRRRRPGVRASTRTRRATGACRWSAPAACAASRPRASGGERDRACARPPRRSRAPTAASPPTPPRC